MRIVIIGGLGLIGKALATKALKRGHVVTTLTRHAISDADQMVNRNVVHWDGVDSTALAKIIENTDVIVNLAGESIGVGRWTQQRKSTLLKSRLEPARALVEALKFVSIRPKTLVQSSAIGIYGIGDREKTEESKPGNDYLAKFAQEWELSTKSVEDLSVRILVIRTGIVLALGKGVLPQLMLPFRLLVGGPVGSGHQWYSWIHIQDEVKAILFLIENPESKGIYNLTSPNPITNSEMGKTLGKVMNRPFWMPVPGFILKLVLGEMSTLVLDGQKVLPSRLQSEGFKFQFPDAKTAIQDLLK
jgi:uncharacterized protein (TIGR01777 family)